MTEGGGVEQDDLLEVPVIVCTSDTIVTEANLMEDFLEGLQQNVNGKKDLSSSRENLLLFFI